MFIEAKDDAVKFNSLRVYREVKKLRKLLGLEPVSLMIKKSRLRRFGHLERKYDNDWVKRCIMWEVEGIRRRGCPNKTWWDCVKNDMESFVLSQLRGQPANPGSLEKWSLKQCVCVCDLPSVLNLWHIHLYRINNLKCINVDCRRSSTSCSVSASQSSSSSFLS